MSMKRLVVLGGILCAGVLVFMAVNRKCGQAVLEPEVPEDPLTTLEWSHRTLVMNVGETKVIEWASNKAIQPVVYCEGSAAAVTALLGNGVQIKALAGGDCLLTVKHGNLKSVCAITVNNEAFSFILPGEDGFDTMIEEINLGVGDLKTVDVLAEPVSLLTQTDIKYRILDETTAGIIDSDSYYVTVQGRKKGRTTLIAEWRGKRIEAALDVTENEPCVIAVPYTKRYLNIGQETKITARLENGGAGNEAQFRFTLEQASPSEPGNSISVEGINNTAAVKALREGVQNIRVSHPMAKDSRIITFDVLPSGPPPLPAIELSESPMLVAKGETRPLTMTVLNGKTTDNQKFSFQVAENGYAVEAKQQGNILHITGVAPGAALIRISNSAVSRDYELMVVVDSYGFN